MKSEQNGGTKTERIVKEMTVYLRSLLVCLVILT